MCAVLQPLMAYDQIVEKIEGSDQQPTGFNLWFGINSEAGLGPQ